MTFGFTTSGGENSSEGLVKDLGRIPLNHFDGYKCCSFSAYLELVPEWTCARNKTDKISMDFLSDRRHCPPLHDLRLDLKNCWRNKKAPMTIVFPNPVIDVILPFNSCTESASSSPPKKRFWKKSSLTSTITRSFFHKSHASSLSTHASCFLLRRYFIFDSAYIVFLIFVI